MHPEPQPIPEKSGRIIVTAIVAAVIGALLAGATIFLWQQSRISALQSDLTRAREATQAATAQLSGLKLQVEELTQTAEHQEKKAEKEKDAARKAEKAEKKAEEAAKDAESDLEGKLYGSFKDVGTSPDEVEVDVEQFLTGNAAKRAAKEAGQEFANDYFIVNESTKLRTVPVAGGTQVKILKKGGGSPKHSTVSFSAFSSMFNNPSKDEKHLKLNGYWFWVTDGKITRIEEQFVP